MHIKKKGSALLSSMIILSAMSLLAVMYYKMNRYNVLLSSLNYVHNDRYDFSDEESHTIYEFSRVINLYLKDNEDDLTEEVFNSVSLNEISGYKLLYNNDNDDFILEHAQSEETKIYKSVDYKITNNKVTLIPKYVLEEDDIKFIDKLKR